MAVNFGNLKKLKTIGEYCFTTSGIEEVYLTGANALTTISTRSFNSSPELRFFEAKNIATLTTLGGSSNKAGIFELDTALEIIDFSGTNITSIPYSFCKNCTALKQFIYEDVTTITTIQDQAFYNTTSLETDLDFSMMGSLTTIGKSAFEKCGTGENIFNFERCPIITFSQDYHFYGAKGKILNFSNCVSFTTLSMHFATYSTFEEINFSGCTSFTSFAESTSYTEQTFSKCLQLKTLDLSNCPNLSFLAFRMCEGCTALESVNLTGDISISQIHKNCFNNCSVLSTIIGWNEIKGSITTIQQNAFNNCGALVLDLTDMINLTSLVGENVNTGGNTFANCVSITSEIKNWPKIQNICYQCFLNVPIGDVDLSNSDLTYIRQGAFQGAGKTDGIIFNVSGSNLNTIADWSFQNAKIKLLNASNTLNLRSVSNGHWNCPLLEQVIFDGSGIIVFDADSYYSSNLPQLQTVSCKNCLSLTNINNGFRQWRPTLFDFSGCSSLVSTATLAASGNATTGAVYDFRGCTSLTTVSLSDANIKELYLPNSVTTITSLDAFNASVKTIEVLDFDWTNVTTIVNRDAFRDRTLQTKIDLVLPNLTTLTNDGTFENQNMFLSLDCSNAPITIIPASSFNNLSTKLSLIDFSGCKLTNVKGSAFYSSLIQNGSIKLSFDPDSSGIWSGTSHFTYDSNFDLYIDAIIPPTFDSTFGKFIQTVSGGNITIHLSASAETAYKEAALLLEDAGGGNIIWWCCSNGQATTTTGGTTGSVSASIRHLWNNANITILFDI